MQPLLYCLFRRTVPTALAASLAGFFACSAEGPSSAPSSQPASLSKLTITPSATGARFAKEPLTHSVKRSSRIIKSDDAQKPSIARANLRAAWIQAAQAQAGDAYNPQMAGRALVRLNNSLQTFHAELHSGGARFLVDSPAQASLTGQTGSHSTSFSLRRYGCDGDSTGTQSQVQPVVRGPRVVYPRGTVTEWYLNGPLGVEQGFDLTEPPTCRASATSSQVVLELALQGDLHPTLTDGHGNPTIEFRDDRGQPVLRYSDLSVADADGKPVSAQMAIADSGTTVALRINDRFARYPLRVDPLIWAQVGNAIKATTQTTNGPEAGDQLGTSIAISGDTAIVGAPFNNDADVAAGAAFIFTRSAAGQWVQQAEILVGVTANGLFGQSVAISDLGGGNKRVVIGAPDDNGTGSASWFFGSGATWNFESTQAPLAAGGGVRFGISVGVSNDRIIVGGPNLNAADGFVAIYEPDSNVPSTWNEVATLLGPVGLGEQYGTSVSIDTDLALIGAPFRSPAGFAEGGGYDILLRSELGAWTVTQSQTFGQAGAHAGAALALSGTAAVVGAPGAAGDAGLAFEQNLTATGIATGPTTMLSQNGLMPGDLYGSSVAVNGPLAVVGAPARNGSAGDAFVFELQNGVWTSGGPAIARSGVSSSELFGNSVAVDSASRVIVVGAPENNLGANQSGAFYEIIERKSIGTQCGADAECASNLCIDTVCCNTDCGRGSGAFGSESQTDCQACSASAESLGPDGTCSPARSGQSCHQKSGECDLNQACDGVSTSCALDYEATDGISCSGGSCQVGQCRAEADLAITLTETMKNALPATFTVLVKNNGPSAATAPRIEFAFQNGATLQSTSTNCAVGAGESTCTLSDLAAGASITITLNVQSPGPNKQYTVSSNVSSATFDPQMQNNTATTMAQGGPLGLSGGGYGCSVTPSSGNPSAAALLFLALVGFLSRRRRIEG